jgi:probable F420-dependent oxidoreductase
MAPVRPFRFGTSLPATSRAELVAELQKAKAAGYHAVAVTDHVGRLAPISTLGMLAALDSTLRLTSMVFGNDFRNPVLLANEAATIDLLSEGRLELGIGTGWMGTDYEKTGIAFEPAGVRIERLREAIHIIKGLFSDEAVTVRGRYYTVNNLNLWPKPLQRPHPPILIGGGGKRMLTLAAQEADIVSINPRSVDGGMDLTTLTVESYAQRIEWVREAAGERINDIELHTYIFWVIVTDDQEQEAQKLIQAAESDHLRRGESLTTGAHAFTVETILDSPHVLIGTVDQMAAQLEERRRRFGVSYYTPSSGIGPGTFGPVVSRLAGK